MPNETTYNLSFYLRGGQVVTVEVKEGYEIYQDNETFRFSGYNFEPVEAESFTRVEIDAVDAVTVRKVGGG